VSNAPVNGSREDQSDLLLSVNGARLSVSLAAGRSPATARLPTAPHRWFGIFTGLRPVGMTGRWRGQTAVTPIAVGDSELSCNRDTIGVRESVSSVLGLGVPILCI